MRQSPADTTEAPPLSIIQINGLPAEAGTLTLTCKLASSASGNKNTAAEAKSFCVLSSSRGNFSYDRASECAALDWLENVTAEQITHEIGFLVKATLGWDEIKNATINHMCVSVIVCALWYGWIS